MNTFTNKIAQVKVGTHDGNKSALRTIIWLSVICALVYMYYIGSIVFNVIARKNVENENKAISSAIAETQVTYLSRIGSIDKSFAFAKGYEDPTSPSYVISKSTVGMVR